MSSKISELTAATAVADADVLAMVVGGVSRKVSVAVIRQAVNSESGLVADGVTDNATALQAALTAARVAGGGWVNLQTPGIYAITAPLVIGSGTRLTLGPGVTIKRTDATAYTPMLKNYAAQQIATLSTGINSGATAVIISATTGYSTAKAIRIGDEWMTVTAVAGTAPGTLTVTRGASSSVAASHLAGALVMTQLTGITRDHDIIIEGGSWNNDSKNTDYHIIQLNNCDHFAVRDLTVLYGSKYAISPNDCHYWTIENIYFDTSSDGVHVIGPASHFAIRNITGNSLDDPVALTTADWAGYAATDGGDVTDGTVDGVHLSATTTGSIKLTGNVYSMDRMEISNVSGGAAAYGAVLIINDVPPGAGNFRYANLNFFNIKGNGVDRYARVQGTGGQVTFRDCDLSFIVDVTSIDYLNFINCSMTGATAHFLDLGNSASYVKNLSVLGGNIKFGAASTRAFLQTNGGTKIDTLRVEGVNIDGPYDVFSFQGLGGDLKMISTGNRFANFTRILISPSGGTGGAERVMKWLESGCFYDIAYTRFLVQFGGTLALTGTGVIGPDEAGHNVGWTDTEAGVLILNYPGYRTNPGSTTPQTGYQVFNANADGYGWSGPAIYNGSGWVKHGW